MADDSKNTAANTWVINRGNCRGRADTYLSPSQNFLLKEHFQKKTDQDNGNSFKEICLNGTVPGQGKRRC